MSGAEIELIVEEPAWEHALPGLAALAAEAAALALAGTGVSAAGCGVAILACDDARIAALNTRFRDRAGPTNVLSWPAFSLRSARPGAAPAPPPAPDHATGESPPLHLGDLAIALETTRNEAESASIPLKDHTFHLILHGILHLLGYDHENDADARMMEDLESRLMQEAGFPDPYSRGDAARPQSD